MSASTEVYTKQKGLVHFTAYSINDNFTHSLQYNWTPGYEVDKTAPKGNAPGGGTNQLHTHERVYSHVFCLGTLPNHDIPDDFLQSLYVSRRNRYCTLRPADYINGS